MEILDAIFKLLAGIGLFLFAMYLLEESLQNLSGRNFKRFLQRITSNKIGAVSGGALVTGVLQSSSMVSIMVLAFVGAGVFTMKNAMAIILGANLGTTLDSWVVATLGFKVDIEIVAYPMVFAAGLMLMFFRNRTSLKYLSYFLFGFGLLFIGLALMKNAMEAQVKVFDFKPYAAMPLVFFLMVGFLITILVQSSSVTMAITLSALYAGAVQFPAAAAIVLGSETATTIKILLGAVGGNVAKKRVAFGNFLFNIMLTILAFTFIRSILSLITDVFHITNPLIGLVTFSSLINLFTIILFLPFLDQFAKFLERFFKDSDASAAAFIGNASIEEPQSALDLFQKESHYFLHCCMLLNLQQFEIKSDWLEKEHDFFDIISKRKLLSKSKEEKYQYIQQLQGEIQLFYLELRVKLVDEQYTLLEQWISAVRNMLYATKSINDIQRNIIDLKHSSKDIKFNVFVKRQKNMEVLYEKLDMFMHPTNANDWETMQHVFETIQKNYETTVIDFYKTISVQAIEELDMSTVIIFNRELFSSNKAMLLAVKDLILDVKSAQLFDNAPSYKFTGI